MPYARVEGGVTSILVRPGQEVQAGDMLALIESLPVEAMRLELKQAEIGLALDCGEERTSRRLGKQIWWWGQNQAATSCSASIHPTANRLQP